MAWIDEPWLRRAFDALKETLDSDPRLKREMIQFLLDEGFWDSKHLKWDSAVARFNACLNPARDDAFKVGEIWALMKRFGRHQLFLAMAEDLGYEARRIPTEERRQELLERIADASERHERLLGELHGDLVRLSEQAPSAAGAAPGQVARLHFSRDGSRQGVP